MEEKRYLISDAAKKVAVETHVLRYWEEELKLPISRTELGHRYYTEEDILTFQNIKELKERGLQLKAIKVLLPELSKRHGKAPDNIINLEQKLNQRAREGQAPGQEAKKEALEVEPPQPELALLPAEVDLDKYQQFETIMTNIFKKTLQDNNQELENRISDSVLKGVDILMQMREEKEEERYRRLDEVIRSHQKRGREVAATRESIRFPFSRKKKNR